MVFAIFVEGAADWGAGDNLIDIYIYDEPSNYLASVDMKPVVRENLSYMLIEIIPNPAIAMHQSAGYWG